MPTLSQRQLNIMDGKTNRYGFKRQCIRKLKCSHCSAHNFLSNLQPLGSKDVSFFAVGVKDQCDICTTVRIIFDSSNRTRNTVLIAFKIDLAILPLMSTALMPNGNTPMAIPPCIGFFSGCKAFFRFLRSDFITQQVNSTAHTRCYRLI